MKLFYSIVGIAFFSMTSLAIDIVIKTEEKKEEKKEEDKGPELPKPAQLAINVLNDTDNDVVVTATAKITDAPYGFLYVQHRVEKANNTTLAVLNAPSESSFTLSESEVVLLKKSGDMDQNVKIKCTIKAENKDDADKDQEEEASNVATKSIDFYLYKVKNQKIPACAILFDSFE